MIAVNVTRCIKPLTTINHHYLSYPKPAAKRWAFTTNFRLKGIGPPGVPMSPKAIGWPCQVRAIVVAPGMDMVREMGIEWNTDVASGYLTLCHGKFMA